MDQREWVVDGGNTRTGRRHRSLSPPMRRSTVFGMIPPPPSRPAHHVRVAGRPAPGSSDRGVNQEARTESVLQSQQLQQLQQPHRRRPLPRRQTHRGSDVGTAPRVARSANMHGTAEEPNMQFRPSRVANTSRQQRVRLSDSSPVVVGSSTRSTSNNNHNHNHNNQHNTQPNYNGDNSGRGVDGGTPARLEGVPSMTKTTSTENMPAMGGTSVIVRSLQRALVMQEGQEGKKEGTTDDLIAHANEELEKARLDVYEAESRVFRAWLAENRAREAIYPFKEKASEASKVAGEARKLADEVADHAETIRRKLNNANVVRERTAQYLAEAAAELGYSKTAFQEEFGAEDVTNANDGDSDDDNDDDDNDDCNCNGFKRPGSASSSVSLPTADKDDDDDDDEMYAEENEEYEEEEQDREEEAGMTDVDVGSKRKQRPDPNDTTCEVSSCLIKSLKRGGVDNDGNGSNGRDGRDGGGRDIRGVEDKSNREVALSAAVARFGCERKFDDGKADQDHGEEEGQKKGMGTNERAGAEIARDKLRVHLRAKMRRHERALVVAEKKAAEAELNASSLQDAGIQCDVWADMKEKAAVKLEKIAKTYRVELVAEKEKVKAPAAEVYEGTVSHLNEKLAVVAEKVRRVQPAKDVLREAGEVADLAAEAFSPDHRKKQEQLAGDAASILLGFKKRLYKGTKPVFLPVLRGIEMLKPYEACLDVEKEATDERRNQERREQAVARREAAAKKAAAVKLRRRAKLKAGRNGDVGAAVAGTAMAVGAVSMVPRAGETGAAVRGGEECGKRSRKSNRTSHMTSVKATYLEQKGLRVMS